MDTSSTVLVKPLAKGQITIPVGFRKQLGITRSSYLKAEVKAGKLILSPVQLAEEEKYLRSSSIMKNPLKKTRESEEQVTLLIPLNCAMEKAVDYGQKPFPQRI